MAPRAAIANAREVSSTRRPWIRLRFNTARSESIAPGSATQGQSLERGDLLRQEARGDELADQRWNQAVVTENTERRRDVPDEVGAVRPLATIVLGLGNGLRGREQREGQRVQSTDPEVAAIQPRREGLRCVSAACEAEGDGRGRLLLRGGCSS